MAKRVVVGMSGGVDSSVAALLLKNRGFEVEGLSLLMFETRGGGQQDPRSCCSLESVADAARTASIIGIPHRAIDCRDIFIEKVIEPFALAYSNGLTPNPCILCNRHVKIPLLLEAANERGAEFIATGHYARMRQHGEGPELMSALDEKKDQSYVLYAQKKEELQRLLLPLGDLGKQDVRKLAGEAGLPVFNRPESQEICFVQGKDYLGMVRALVPGSLAEGPILDGDGKQIGAHSGISGYTIGQRKGLGGNRRKPGGRDPNPLYVYRIDASRNAIYAGPKEKAFVKTIEAEGVNWLLPGHRGMQEFEAGVKVRSMMRPARARVYPLGANENARIEFQGPQWAPAPGQSAVFYDGRSVIGGGVIKPWQSDEKGVS